MKSIEKLQVYYIASAGRSGSTLLDIILGNSKSTFSCGELTNLFSNGYKKNEYCSCKNKVNECVFWSKVISDWIDASILSVEDYQLILNEYLRNKATLLLLKQLVFPSQQFSNALRDTRLLYSLIAKHSECNTIIDSSKSAQRILFLRKAGIDTTVILLKRRFANVLNSTKKEFKKDLKMGVEEDLNPMSTRYSLLIWLLDTCLPIIFSFNLKRVKVQYEELISEPTKAFAFVINSQFDELLLKRGPFLAPHLCAGNRMRINDEIYLENKMSDELNNLSTNDMRLVKFLSIIGVK